MKVILSPAAYNALVNDLRDLATSGEEEAQRLAGVLESAPAKWWRFIIIDDSILDDLTAYLVRKGNRVERKLPQQLASLLLVITMLLLYMSLGNSIAVAIVVAASFFGFVALLRVR